MTNPKRGAIRELLALLRPFRAIVAVSIALGMAGGLAITLLLASINNALHSENGLGQGVLLSFGGLCLLALVSSIVSDEAAQGTRRESPLGANRADRALPDPPSHSGTDTRH